MKPLVATALVASALLLGAAGPRTPAPSRWERSPSPAQWAAAKPADAAKQGIDGYAVMRCTVTPPGGLADCRAIIEEPSGHGFAQALVALAPEFQMKPPAAGGDAPGSQVVVVGDWLRFDQPASWQHRPTANDLLVVWPSKAWARGEGGKARIDCLISVQGALFDCVVAAESPAGEHFGDAAVALTPQFLMKPATLGGQKVVSAVAIPIAFQMSAGHGPSSSLGSKKVVQAAMTWPEAPSYADVAAAYPKAARASGLGGRATLDCAFTREGRLASCKTITEDPKGRGFGEAAKALSNRFRAAPGPTGGPPITGGQVQLPIVFDPAMLGGGAPTIGKPQWTSLPNGDDTLAAFGKVMRDSKATARVTLSCSVQQGGTVSGCAVEREEPAGLGLGEAALSLAPHFRLSTWTAEGLPTVGGTIHIPIRYEPAPEPAAKP